METHDYPSWVQEALGLVGLKEVPGPGDNPEILDWARNSPSKFIQNFYKHDSIPWCGLFVEHSLHLAGKETLGDASLSALAWRNYGETLVTASVGAILVFKRPANSGESRLPITMWTAGHVGFCMGEDDTAYHVLGGNQSNAVCVERLLKARCVAMRWPFGEEKPRGAVHVAGQGVISSNEA